MGAKERHAGKNHAFLPAAWACWGLQFRENFREGSATPAKTTLFAGRMGLPRASTPRKFP